MRTIVILLGLFVALCACAQQPTNIDNFAITEKAFSLKGQGKFKEAYNLLKPLADQGDLQGIYRLAELYDYDTSPMPRIKQNPYYDTQKAQELFYIAAKRGHGDSQLALGSNLRYSLRNYRDNPEKLQKVYAEACEWYTKAAMQGVAFGTFAVAQCHKAGGFTGQPDYFLSYAWHAVPEFYQVNKELMADVDDSDFMSQVAQRGKLTQEQKHQALKIAQDIAKKIKKSMKKPKP